MQQDIAELLAWTHWLAEHAGKPPVLIGHSSGGVQLIAMLESNPDLVVDRALLVSLTNFGEGLDPGQNGLLRARANADIERRFNGMDAYSLAFCRRYVTNAASLLSYLEWDRARLERALLAGTLPVTVIFGDRDQRLDKNWLDRLQAGGVKTRSVPGANHFFDLANEIDLLEEVAQVITGSGRG
jgi:pimeloyl-ACP methyl ester carboxylesterase